MLFGVLRALQKDAMQVLRNDTGRVMWDVFSTNRLQVHSCVDSLHVAGLVAMPLNLEDRKAMLLL